MAKKATQAGLVQSNGSVKKLRKLMKDKRVAMLTTVARDGALRSRPMMTSQVEFAGNLWFIAKASSGLVEEITQNPHVNVAYANPKGDRYVSVSGTAALLRDPGKVKELWTGGQKAWFPEGKKDPDLAVVKINVAGADYWDARSTNAVHVSKFVREQLPASPATPRAVEDGTGAGAQG